MGTLRASAGETDLAPPVGAWMSGFCARVAPSTGIHDPVMARAVLLESGGAALAVVSCDLLGLTPLAAALLRARIARRTGGAVPVDGILVACTHTHSGPAAMPMRGVMGCVDGAWLRDALRRIEELVAELACSLRPARVSFGAARVAGIGFNRQDGTQPVDEDLIAMAVDAVDGSRTVPIATLVNFAVHPVILGPSNLRFSGDLAGEAARSLAAGRGGIGVFLQGAGGDVEPVVNRDRGWGAGTFDDARAAGGRLAGEALAALENAAGTDEPAIRVGARMLRIPLDPPPSGPERERMASGFEDGRRAARMPSGNRADELAAEAMLDWASELAYAERRGEVPTALPSELFVAGVGDLRLVGAPFELYSGIATAIRRNLRPLRTMVAGYANGLYGYCPTRTAKAQGGYGPGDSHRWFPELLTPLGYGADELLIREACSLAGALPDRRPATER